MRTDTTYFGEVDYDEEELIHFPRGLYGFEDETDFLLIDFGEDSGLLSLQSVRTPQLSFVLMHPFSLAPEYTPVLQPEELKALEAERSEDLYYYVLCAVKEPVPESTVNMQCPVAINPDTRQAMQVILENGAWHMRHRLADLAAAKEEEPC